MADRQTDDFKLGNKAADMWLYTADACANEKVIPKKYRYTTGTALMNSAEAICSCILEQGGDDGALYVRRLVREGPEPRCPGKRGCSAAIAAFHWGIACSRRQLGPALPELE